MNNQTLKIGNNRGRPRVWIDRAEYLNGAGFTVGARYDVRYLPGDGIVLTLDPDGARKVAQKSGTRPVIDLCSQSVGWALGQSATRADVSFHGNFIAIKPAIQERTDDADPMPTAEGYIE